MAAKSNIMWYRYGTRKVHDECLSGACRVGSAPLVSLLILTMSSEVREKGEVRQCHLDPMMAANDWNRQDGQMIAFLV